MSFWMSVLPPVPPRAPLPGDATSDVAIVGAGYTGLWTAYYLATADPALRIVVLEAEIAGFGASRPQRRLVLGAVPRSRSPRSPARHGADAALALHRGDAGHGRRGRPGRGAPRASTATTPRAARSCWPASPVQLRAGPARGRRGAGAAGRPAAAVRRPRRASGSARPTCSAATYTPHCAAIHPARLVRGLAAAVERRGRHDHERTPVTAHRPPGACDTPRGTVRAPIVVRATEGYTPRLPGLRRAIAPGLLADDRDRAAAGVVLGRGSGWRGARRSPTTGTSSSTASAPPTTGSRSAAAARRTTSARRSRPAFDRDAAGLRRAAPRSLVELFPALGDVADHPRVGRPARHRRATGAPRSASTGPPGSAWAGGYVGDGVGTTNLAGRTLADLIRGSDTELTGCRGSATARRRWEPEPLRWLGVNAGLRVMTGADAEERGPAGRRAGPR